MTCHVQGEASYRMTLKNETQKIALLTFRRSFGALSMHILGVGVQASACFFAA